MLTEKTVVKFLDELASNSPAPGGGSVAALAGALGAALTSMVANLTVGKKKYLDVEAEIISLRTKTEELRKTFTVIIDQDTDAFNKVMEAFGLPKESDDQKALRSAAIQEATKEATLVPLRVMKLVVDALALTKVVADKGNANSASDAGVAALMLHAGAESAALNVYINLNGINDQRILRNYVLHPGVTDVPGILIFTSIEVIGKLREIEPYVGILLVFLCESERRLRCPSILEILHMHVRFLHHPIGQRCFVLFITGKINQSLYRFHRLSVCSLCDCL